MSDLTKVQEQVFNLLNLSFKNRTPKGWYMGGTCPRCGKNDKFGVKLNNNREGEYKNHVTVNCFHGSCEFKGSEKVLFKELGREDLIQKHEYREELSVGRKLKKRIEEEVEYEPLKKRHLPLGYKRVFSHEYLESRGFTEIDFKLYDIGVTNLFPKLKNYVVFLVKEDGHNIGWVARIAIETSQLKEINTKRKEDGKQPLPKYRNEGGIEFSETFYGIDEVNTEVETIILVEGITDKTSVTRELKLYKEDKIKCLCTFGKKISSIQIKKLKNKGQNIKNIILMYDPDAVKSIKQYSYDLVFEFPNVKVAKLTGEKDPGDMVATELIEVLKNTETFLSYRVSTVNRRELK